MVWRAIVGTVTVLHSSPDLPSAVVIDAFRVEVAQPRPLACLAPPDGMAGLCSALSIEGRGVNGDFDVDGRHAKPYIPSPPSVLRGQTRLLELEPDSD